MSTPYYQDDMVTVHHGDCIDVMRTIRDASVDAVVTDPPYGLGFMGKAWDDLPPGREWAAECLRVLKPGGHLLAFGGSRTWHRLAVAVEDAGFEIRDSIAWLYGSGFPKSLDVSKAIDKARHSRDDVLRVTAWIAERATGRALDAAAGTNGMGGHWTTQGPQAVIPTAEAWELISPLLGGAPGWLLALIKPARSFGEAWGQRPITQEAARPSSPGDVITFDQRSSTERERRDIPATDQAQRWQGWGTALKPAFEPVVVGRKPLGGTVATNVQVYGTGALNIDGCRVPSGDDTSRRPSVVGDTSAPFGRGVAMGGNGSAFGRWPPNVVLDDTQAAELDRQTGVSISAVRQPTGRDTRGTPNGSTPVTRFHDTQERGVADSGGASRFFPTFRYEAKAPASERPTVDGIAHPTVKPLDLMRWLVRLVTPRGGVVLDPFAGSGTTAEACILEHFRCITIEREAEHLPLIVARLSKPLQAGFDFGEETA